MIKRLRDNEVNIDKEVIKCHSFDRQMILQFILNLLHIVHPEDCKWNYDYAEKKMKRDDFHWKKLFLLSRGEDFDISNLWKLYFEGDKQGSINLKSDRKLVCDLGNFGVPIGNA